MQQHRLLPVVLALLLLSVRIAAAQTAPTYVLQRFVMVGGAMADSSTYAITSVFGQPVTDVADSPSYQVSGGFLFSQPQGSQLHEGLWLPMIEKVR